MDLHRLRRIVGSRKSSKPSRPFRGNRISPAPRRLRCESLEDRRLLAILVSTAVDENDGIHTSGNLSLREALDIAAATPGDDLIEFNAALSGSTISLQSALGPLVVDSNVEIVLPDTRQLTVDAGGNGRAFDVLDGVTAGIRGLTVTGGGIDNAGDLTIADASITGNEAFSGGGIYNSGTLRIAATELSHNTTSAASASQDAGDGGAIYNDGGTVTIASSSTLSDNSTGTGGSGGYNGGRGGAIYNSAGSLTITDSTLRDNRTGDGNATSIAGHGGAGGAIFSELGTVRVEDTTFDGNQTGQGGSGADFAGNGGDGGAIYSEAETLTIARSTFSMNSTGRGGAGTPASGGDGGSGGAISTLDVTLTIDGSIFSENSTGWGGNAGDWGGTAGNGGAVSCAAGSTTIRGSTFVLNSAGSGGIGSGADSLAGHGGSGGGVYVAGTDLRIETSTLDRNSTGSGGNAAFLGGNGGDGAGVCVFHGKATILDASLVENFTGSAGSGSFIQGTAGDGGGIYNEPAELADRLTVANTTISGNLAANNGGGICHRADGEATITNATIVDNTAVLGGGVWTVSDTITLYNTIVGLNSSNDVTGFLNPAGSHNLIGGNPMLGALADNGGPTETRMPLAGSPAIDTGSNDRAADAGLAGDQRGFYRLADGDGNSSLVVDVGAVEYGSLLPADVVARHVFYNDSYFDDGPAANSADDGAIAPSPAEANSSELGKTPLLPGQTATFQNITSYNKGINGIMIDVLGLANPGSLNASDFQFKAGNSNDPSSWGNAPPPLSIDVRGGEGEGGSDRITILWPSYSASTPNPATQAVVGRWLQVTVLDTDNTGLIEPDVFYWGNAPGDSGTFNTATLALVNAFDSGAARDNPHGPGNRAAIDDFADYNRDSLVNAFDFGLVRDNPTNPGNATKFITAPLPPAEPVEGLPAPAGAAADTAALYDVALGDLDAAEKGTDSTDAGGTMPASLFWLDDTWLSAEGESSQPTAEQARAAVEELLATL